MRIRKLNKNDFFRFNEMDWSPLPKERDSIYLVLAIEQADCSFVAEEGEEFLGVILCSRSANGDSIYINHIIVEQKARKLGVGRKLIARMESYARRNGVKRIWLFCYDELMKWYTGLGYRESYKIFTPELKKYIREKKGVHAFIKELKTV